MAGPGGAVNEPRDFIQHDRAFDDPDDSARRDETIIDPCKIGDHGETITSPAIYRGANMLAPFDKLFQQFAKQSQPRVLAAVLSVPIGDNDPRFRSSIRPRSW